MRVLLVKMSSLGDVVHTLPALAELKAHCPELQIDWLLEPAFADIGELAQQQGLVNAVIPIRLRKWRREKPLTFLWHTEAKALKAFLQSQSYDLVVDAQGLLKSAWVARWAKTSIVGLDKASARESWASRFYDKQIAVAPRQHAIYRLQKLFAQAFGYEAVLKPEKVSVANDKTENNQSSDKPYILFFQGTTWENKRYPTAHWQGLIQLLANRYDIKIAQGNAFERSNAYILAQGQPHVSVLPNCHISELITEIRSAAAVVSVDTGLAHLADFYGVPVVALFGPTNPRLTGMTGPLGRNMTGLEACAPCMQRSCYKPQSGFAPCMWQLAPERVMETLEALLASAQP